jgi:hypothetical protein
MVMKKYKQKVFYKCRMCEKIFKVDFETDRDDSRYLPFNANHYNCVDAEALSNEGTLVGMGELVALDLTPYINLKRKEDNEDNMQ